MSVRTWLTKLPGLGRGGGTTLGSGTGMFSMSLPPMSSNAQLLHYYGNLGWVFRAASIIGHSVAQEGWTLQKKTGNDEWDDVPTHEVLNLLHMVNPYFTRYEFMYLQTLYLVLVGESFTVMDTYKSTGRPAQMWSALPHGMTIHRNSPQEYISFYRYNIGSIPIDFPVNEVIHIKNPNPAGPMRGVGPVQALAPDLNVDRYASRYQERLFFNDATPSFFLEFPDMPDKDTRKKLREEWHELYGGMENARKTAFLWGGAKVNSVTMSNKELDFWKSTQARGEKILDVMGVPSQLITGKAANRATADVLKYMFAETTVKPILIQFREAFNEQLLPLFPGTDNMRLVFDDPVPENREALIDEIEKMVKAQIYTREEARTMLGKDPEPANGGTFIAPATVGVPPQAPKALKMIDEVKGGEIWKQWVDRASKRESGMVPKMQEMFAEQEKEALKKLTAATRRASQIFDRAKAKRQFKDAATPIIKDTLAEAIEDGLRLVEPSLDQRGYKQGELPPASEEWLDTRMAWAAAEIGEETARMLATQLTEAYAAGESIDQMAVRVRGVFGTCREYRAQRIARTEVMTASNIGAEEGYKESGVVEKVEWYAAMDERLCDICASLHGEQYILGKGDRPPAHVQCRCVILPVT